MKKHVVEILIIVGVAFALGYAVFTFINI